MERVTKVEFPDLFPVEDEEEEDEKTGLGSNDPGVQKQFGFYYILDVLTDGKILDQEQILELPFKRVLFHLLFLKRSNEKNK